MVEKVRAGLKANNIRVHVDDRDGLTPGFKYHDWELKGVPLRIEIGPKDVEKNSLAFARRDIPPGREGKNFVSMDGFEQSVADMLVTIQDNMLAKAIAFRDAHIFEVDNYEDFKDVVENKGWAKVWWYADSENEELIKTETKAKLLNFTETEGEGVCFYSGRKTNTQVFFAKTY